MLHDLNANIDNMLVENKETLKLNAELAATCCLSGKLFTLAIGEAMEDLGLSWEPYITGLSSSKPRGPLSCGSGRA